MKNRRAFTLVELLVVIGIIALLISILLPTLGRAREAAQRAACLSNIRELGNAMRIYASQFKDSVPLGCVASAASNAGSEKYFAYVVRWYNSNSNGKPQATQLGLLARAGLLKSGKAFYCPSYNQSNDAQYQFDNPASNPWPYDKDPEPTGVVTHTRFSYMCRPIAIFPVTDAFQASGGMMPYLFPEKGGEILPYKRGFPKLFKLRNQAIVTDMMRFRPDITKAHKYGINVLYANGGAKYVPLKVFDNGAWKLNTSSAPPNNVMLDHTIAQPTGIWIDLDKAP